jgi:hypothetical protein
MLRLIASLVGSETLSGCAAASASPDPERDKSAIEAVTDPAGEVLETGVDDGLDVFRRQPDGTWKIHVSHAFTK